MSEVVGREIPLEDGAPKVQGHVRFCASLARPGQLFARLVTSPHAHALVRSIDCAEALATEGVHAVLTAKDLPSIPPAHRSMLLLADERVRFVGQPVAMVLATSEEAAEDGAEKVFADYEILPAVTELDEALAVDAPAVWPEGNPGQSAEAAAHGATAEAGDSGPPTSPNLSSAVEFERGDLGSGFDEADYVVERSYSTASVHQSYLEPHATLAEFDPTGDSLTLWTSTQAIYYVRGAVASALGFDASSVRIIGTPVGGGFGGKFLLYEPLVALAARHVGRPVSFTMSRTEEMIAATPAPATQVALRLGVSRSGRFTALDATLTMNCGCFPSSIGGLAATLLGSNYRLENLRVEGREVLTHRPSTGAYRAPAAPQAAFALESAIDEAAAALDLDPVQLRIDNASRPGDRMASGNPWPSMGFVEVLEAMRDHPWWQQRGERAAGHGIGVAFGGWPGGTEPAAAACSLQGDGTLQINIGSVDITGTRTTFQQIAAETLGIEPEAVRIVSGDTQTAPFAGSSGGSKITYTVGVAVMQAVEEAKQQILDLAAEILEASAEDLEIEDGAVRVKGSPQSAVPLHRIARKTMAFGSQLAPVFGRGRHAQPQQAPGFCGQLAEVSVDSETGQVTVHRLLLIQDVGRAINPLLVRGQMHGGALQGLGWALTEELFYDQDGQPLTATFSDYAIPHVAHLPADLTVEIVEVPAPSGPFGAKGVGEPPVIATAAAVANAVHDAAGLRITQLPMTPARIAQAARTQA